MGSSETSVRGGEGRSLSRAEYERLLEGASTYRKRLLVRLGGEVGLRATETTAIRPKGVVRVRRDPDRFVLRVPEPEGSREAYLPPDVERELSRYVASNGVDGDEPVIDVTPRRVQMLVREVAEGVAESDESWLASVRTHDLRRYFARRLLCERAVPPHVVRSIGGWKSLDALDPYLDEPSTDEIVAALGDERRPPRPARIDSVLIEASTREELENRACEALAGQYRFAWIDTLSIEEASSPNAASGIDPETVRSIRDSLDEEPGDRTPRPLRTEEGPVLAVPVRYGETRYGTLSVGVRSRLSEGEREHLSVLGRRIGHAITAIRRQKLLLADTILELEFHSADAPSALVVATDRFDCRFVLESIASASESALVYYVTLTGARAPAVLEHLAECDGIEDSRLVEGRDSGALLELVVSGGCPLFSLTDYGATVTDATVEDGEARILADCAYDTDLRALVSRLTDAFPDTRLVGKQTTERGARTVEGFTRGAADRLTDRQRAALRAAYFGGYFDWPRGSTAEEVADAMGVSSPTLHSHLRKGQRELLELLFEDE
ncbi:MAG: bacterio-opsin activator domain-containing protein [Halalkalicoccus sp.]